MRALVATFALCAASACSLLVARGPEGRPCDDAGLCLAGFHCADNRCVSDEAVGGGSGGAGGGGGQAGAPGGGFADSGLPPLSFEDLQSGFAAGYCAQLVACGTLAAGTQGVCERMNRNVLQNYADSVDAGRFAIDQAAVRLCLSAFDGGTNICDSLSLWWIFNCQASDFFISQNKVGDACSFGRCAEGYCPSSPASDVCQACVAYKTVGEACTSTQRCDPATAYCPTWLITDGGASKCVARAATGKPCDLGYSECLVGSCVSMAAIDGGTPRCGPLPLGSRCERFADCDVDAYCKGLRVSSLQTLALGVCTRRMVPGSTCVNEQLDDGCAHDAGRAGCLGGKCTVLVDHALPLNAECDYYFLNPCVPGTYCDLPDYYPPDGGAPVHAGVCRPVNAENADCSNGAPCATGTVCATTGKCLRYAAEGEGCGTANNKYCSSLLTCAPGGGAMSQTCVAPPKLGGACDTSASLDCDDAYCQTDGGKNAPGKCVTRSPLGGPCDSNRDCARGECLRTTASNTARTCQLCQ